MKVFFSSLLAFVALTFCFNASAQDIIYTIRGEINHQTTALDSISIENITKQSSFGFGELPELDDYRINLTQNKFWGSTSVYDLTYDNSLHLHENRPGLVSVGYNGQTATNASITLYNVNGQKLLAKNDLTLDMGSLVEVEINQAGVYLLYINTPRETRTFKAIGASKSGQLAIALQSNSATPLKSGQLYHIDNQTQSGDNIKIRVFKNNYVAEPIEIRVEKDTSLVFALDSLTAPTVQTLEASDILMNSATLNGTILNNGNSSIIEYGFYWSATNENPGEADNKIVVEGTTGSLSANLSGLEHATTYYVRAYAINAIGTSYGEQISFITLDLISICDALDNCNLTFTHSGNAEWFAETEVSFNGGSSAQSGSIGHNQQSTLETTVTGPGIVSFYWKVSSQSNYDKLKFYMGTTLKDNISGNVDWELKEYEIPEGSHTLKWRYTKDGSSSGGQDCGWLDKIVYTIVEPTLPTVTTANITNISQTTASTGGEVTSSGFASITARGVCWNTTGNPTISDNKSTEGENMGAFTSNVTWLTPNTTYYVRAYATNSEGTAYGVQRSFSTSQTFNEGEVYNPATGKTWMDRNLGASRAATSSTDSLAYGDLYQWGRSTDGHEKRNSAITKIHSNTNTPNHDKLIKTWTSPDDWRTPQNDNLWQGVSGINNPCPNGFRLPTIAEWDEESQSWNKKFGKPDFNSSTLKLPLAGMRFCNGKLSNVGGNAFYWSSTVDGTNSRFLYFYRNNNYSNVLLNYNASRSDSYSVRCIKDSGTSVSIPTITTLSIVNISQTTATGGGVVISDNGAKVIARGICWNTTGNPTLADSKTTNGTGTGSWISELTELQSNTNYYVRAYATNSQGTAYGESVMFSNFDNEGVKDLETAVFDVFNPATGKTWMDRNLGASRAATSLIDIESYGDLYQWGRGADGHQKSNSPVTSTISTSDTPGHGNFIVIGWSSRDWHYPLNYNLWQGVRGKNNPCPNGYRLPTLAEWEAERQSWNSNNAEGAFASPLKLLMAGYRDYKEGKSYIGVKGTYSSSTTYATQPGELHFEDNWALTLYGTITNGSSVRCIKD